MEVRELS